MCPCGCPRFAYSTRNCLPLTKCVSPARPVFVDMLTYANRRLRDPHSASRRAGGDVALQATLAVTTLRYDSNAARERQHLFFAGVRGVASDGQAGAAMIIGTLQGDGRAEAEVGRWCGLRGSAHLKGARSGTLANLEECSTSHTTRLRTRPLRVACRADGAR